MRHYRYAEITAAAEQTGGAVLTLHEGDSAWDPTSTRRALHGPAEVTYAQHADGGWTAAVGPPAPDIQVVMIPGHRRAYEAWLAEHGLMLSRIPGSADDLPTYAPGPAPAPRGARR